MSHTAEKCSDPNCLGHFETEGGFHMIHEIRLPLRAPDYPDLAYQDGVLVRGRYLGNGKFLKEPNEHQAEEAAEARAASSPQYEGR